jgi:hypothetical protein
METKQVFAEFLIFLFPFYVIMSTAALRRLKGRILLFALIDECADKITVFFTTIYQLLRLCNLAR